MKKIAIFASGSGSNAENIINYFKNDTENVVKIVFCNKPDAYVLERAKRLSVPTFVFGREEFSRSDLVLNELKRLDIDLIVLAGFLWKVPDAIIDAYPDRVINIHPALVIAAGEKESGITIHHVNNHYDEGTTIFQAKCDIVPGDTPETLATKVHALEYEHFPRVIKDVLDNL